MFFTIGCRIDVVVFRCDEELNERGVGELSIELALLVPNPVSPRSSPPASSHTITSGKSKVALT